jgi:hypothetical protein
MKKVVLALFMGLALLWNCGTVLAQGSNQETTAGSKRDRIRRELRAPSRAAEPNDPRRQAELERARQREKEREMARQAREKRRQELMKMREKSLAAMEKAGYGADANRAGAAARGRDHAEQLKQLEQQIARQQQKHLERMAKLNRIKELATKKDAKYAIGRVDTLIQKQQRLHDRRHRRIQMRMSMIKRLEARKSGAEVPDKKRLQPETRKMIEEYRRKNRPVPRGKEPAAGEKSGQ